MAKYLSARQLGVTLTTREYLIYAAKTLPKLSRPRKLNGGTFGFVMGSILIERDCGFQPTDFKDCECGTAGCILGLMQYKARLDGVRERSIEAFESGATYRLFYPGINRSFSEITNSDAAKATDNFLKTGGICFT